MHWSVLDGLVLMDVLLLYTTCIITYYIIMPQKTLILDMTVLPWSVFCVNNDNSTMCCKTSPTDYNCKYNFVAIVTVTLELAWLFFFFLITPLHMHYFHHFLFLPFNQPTGSLQRGVMTCSHLHPLRPQPSSIPHGFHYFYTHTHLSLSMVLYAFTNSTPMHACALLPPRDT